MFTLSEELHDLAQKVIAEHDNLGIIDDPECRIAYMYSDVSKSSKGKPLFADTEKLNDKMKALANVDFIITFYTPNVEDLDDKRKEILMYHELKHVGFDPDKQRYWIIPHDVEDFSEIIESYGTDWII